MSALLQARTITATSGDFEASGRRSPLVKPFAAAGAVCLLIGFQAWVRWIFSGDFTSAPTGPDVISTTHLVLLRVFEFGSLAGGLLLVWSFVLRPFLRDRTFNFDSMLVIGGLSTWWADPTGNYFRATVAYNTHVINMGSWSRFIPGWTSRNGGRLAEPLLAISGAYIWWIFGMAFVGCAVMRRVKARHPDLTLMGLFAICFMAFFVIDLIFEFLFIFTFQVWAYSAVYKPLTLFAGRSYQFPLYQPFLMGLMSVLLAAMRYCRDDTGRSFVERGVDQLGVGERARKAMSFLAICGYLQFGVFIVGNAVPYILFSNLANTTATLPSYLRSPLCDDVTRPCKLGPPDPAVPVADSPTDGLPTGRR